ncbi:MAG: hypothetical protein ACTHU0_02540 [Kofleriaceae bacterium]
MKRALAIAVCLATGCEARIGDGNELVGGRDAPIRSGDDADVLPPLDAPEPDAPACFNGRVVYLNFGGVTLTDAATSDATQNRASWMQISQGTAPPFRQNAADRAQQIQAITDGVRAQLSSFPITVVTQRPAAGPYVMIVLGGTAQQVGSRYGVAVNALDCGDNTKSDVAWISDNSGSTQRVVNTAIGAIGFGLGLTATTDPNDCMCSWDNGCQPNNNAPCTLSPNIARDPNANQRCAGLTSQNEVETFRAAFCQ